MLHIKTPRHALETSIPSLLLDNSLSFLQQTLSISLLVMKTLTSFFALFAARRSFTVVVRPRVNFPGLTVPGPSFLQQSVVPLSYQAKRHLRVAAQATSAMVQRDDEEEDVTCYPQPSVFDLPFHLLERGIYSVPVVHLSLRPKEVFEKFV